MNQESRKEKIGGPTINVAIVGFGQVAKVRHLEAIKRNKKYRLAGIVDPKPRHHDFLKKHKINIYENFNEVLNDSEIDLVVVTVPPHEHYKICKRAIEHGKNVLCEKPFMTSKVHAEEILELASRKGVVMHVVQNFYYSDGMTQIKKSLDDKLYGDLIGFRAVQWSNNSRRIPEWHDRIEGGLFFDEMPHFVYLVSKVFGTPRGEDIGLVRRNRASEGWTVELEAEGYSGRFDCWFRAPMSEWFLILIGSKRVAIYDIYRDIAIEIGVEDKRSPIGVFLRGFEISYKLAASCLSRIVKRYTRGRNLYGHEAMYSKLAIAIESRDVSNLPLHDEVAHTEFLLEIVDRAKRESRGA